MTRSVLNSLKEHYNKASCELRFLRGRSYPDFVFRRQTGELNGEIPVFCFHSVSPDDFEEKLAYLKANSYRTLTADAFYECLQGKRPAHPKAVMLTFDDGWRSLWAVAYPLLRKNGLVGVAFIVPNWVQDSEECYSNLEDHWDGKATLEEVLAQNDGASPYVTWQEVQRMHKSGVIDFQSHSLTHGTVFTSEQIVDF